MYYNKNLVRTPALQNYSGDVLPDHMTDTILFRIIKSSGKRLITDSQ
jgi:hypothetical protein